MRVIEIYKTSNPAEAQSICQILEDAEIKCRVVGGDLAAFGAGTGLALSSILVAEDDAEHARELVAARLADLGIYQSKSTRPFQFGLAVVFVVITLVAVVLGLYPTLGPELTLPLVVGVLTALLMVFAYLHKRYRTIIDEASTEGLDTDD